MSAPIPLDRIVIDGGTQMRVTMSAEHVSDLVAVLASGATLPAVDVVKDPERGFYLVDGFHRFAAHREAGRKVITANVLAGETRADAIWHASGKNLVHGLRRTNADKRKAVRAALEVDDEASDRRIAEHCGVSADLVADVRQVIEAERKPPEPQLSESTVPERKRKGRDGKVRSLPKPPRVPAEAKAVAVTAPLPEPPGDDVAHSPDPLKMALAGTSDATGVPIPRSMQKQWQALLDRSGKVIAGLREARFGIAALKTLPATAHSMSVAQRDALHRFGADLDAMIVRAEGYQPHAVCCEGGCSRCKGRGWLNKQEYLAMVRGQEAKR